MIEWAIHHKEAVSLGFGFAAFCYVLIRIFSWFRNKDIVNIESKLRQKWQAEFFDRNHKDYIDLRDKYDALKDDLNRLKVILAILQKESKNKT